MNPQAAEKLVHFWLQAHDDPEKVAPQRGPVSRAVRELAPDGRLVGIGQTPSGPAMASCSISGCSSSRPARWRR